MNYKNFSTALYCVEGHLESITDWEKFEEEFSYIDAHAAIDKVYVETYRRNEFISKEKLLQAIDFFKKKNIQVSGGITISARGKTSWDFRSFCYSNPDDLAELDRVIEFTAAYFDEIILDDFYFTNCKCDLCIQEKGDRSWWEFRTEQLKDASERIMSSARKINPNVNMIIKYPNWYDDYQYTGYNLKDQPHIFDMIYTGTETRDSALTQQTLPRYLSYFLMRYLENVKPGKNGGGWFDPFDCSYNLNSYLEQAYLTLWAKAREVTLFCMHALVQDFTQFVPLAGYAFKRLDKMLAELGEPVGIACYKPYHSAGENYLLPTLGMLGIPLEPYPEYPEEAETVLLSESAASDTELIDKMKKSLEKGHTIIMTSGLAKALHDKGLEDIIDLEITGRKAAMERIAVDMHLCGYRAYYDLPKNIIIPQLVQRNNDSWPIIVGQNGENGYPLLLQTEYSNGTLFVITIPETFSEMYHYPKEVIDAIRKHFMTAMPVTISAPAKVGLFTYDNETFVVESFLTKTTPITIKINRPGVTLVNIETGKEMTGHTIDNETHFSYDLAASTFMACKIRS